MDSKQLSKTAQELVASPKGILAADESSGTIQRRFDSIGVESTEESRRDYRELLFTTPGMEEYISGVILYDETIRQSGKDGTPLIHMLINQGIIPGIKVDKGAKSLAGANGESATEGLDGLRERLAEYNELGARFTKWRSVITIGETLPSEYCIKINARSLGCFAALSQEAGLVPIIEPEVLMDGGHDIERCFDVTAATLREVFNELVLQRVDLDGTLLKTNMILSGKDASGRAGPDLVGERTIDCFKQVVPASCPGVVFLSGGQSDEESVNNLNGINQQARRVSSPWELSFSYGRGLQSACLKAWSGFAANGEEAQQAFYQRAKVTSAAREGEYKPSMT